MTLNNECMQFGGCARERERKGKRALMKLYKLRLTSSFALWAGVEIGSKNQREGTKRWRVRVSGKAIKNQTIVEAKRVISFETRYVRVAAQTKHLPRF